MTSVECAQFRYTWAARGLDGHTGGFGVVVRSRAWPAALAADPVLTELLTNLSTAARREPADQAEPRLTHLSVAGGSLLVAKRAVGTDGAGRPGNFAVHALFDPTATLGSLDLGPLATGGTFRLERDVDVEPDGDAPPLRVYAAASWRETVHPAEAGSAGPWGDEPAPYAATDGYASWVAGLVARVPADLVNQLQLRAAEGPGPPVPGFVDDLVQRFGPAVELGAADHDGWWERHGRSIAEWDEELHRFLVQNRPVQQVTDAQLWQRWDAANERGRMVVATELLRRPKLAVDETAVQELRRRPGLLDALIERGVRARSRQREAAALWIAAAGNDAQAVDLAAELLAGATDDLPAALLDRLQRLSPELMPRQLVQTVVDQLDAAKPMADPWREHCLQRLVTGRPTCRHPDELVRSATESELIMVARDRVVDPDGAESAWRILSAWWPADRLTPVFAAAGPVTAAYLLRAPLGSDAAVSPALVTAWPQLAAALHFSDGVRTLLPRLVAGEARLRRQRRLLLIIAGVLVVAVIVLSLIIGLTPDPLTPTR